MPDAISHSPRPADAKSFHGAPILSVGQILSVVLPAIALAFLLIPKETELVERLVEDGRHDRAKQLVVSETANDSSTDGEAASNEAGSAEGLIEILLANGDQAINEKGVARIVKLIEIADDPRAIFQRLEAENDRFTTTGRVACLDALAARAVQTANSTFAVELYQLRWQSEAPDTEKLIEIIAAYRYAGDPKGALDAISRFLRDNGQPFSRLPQNLRMTTVALHREINQGSQAFDLLSKEYQGSLDATNRQHLIDLMTETAVQSERIKDCLPVVEKHVNALSPAKQDWQALLSTSAGKDVDEFLKYGIILAHHREWSGNNKGAFDLYLKLAALGNLEALDRVVVIYPWIDGQAEASALLTSLAPVPERPQYTLLTARLEADRGNLERGIELMAPLVQKKNDPVLWNEYAQMLDEYGQFEEAISAYQLAAEFDPGNSSAVKSSARLLVAHDKKSLEDFAMLAASLGDEKAEERALLLRLDHNIEHPQPGDFEDLCEFYKSRGKLDLAISTARTASDTFPKNRSLTLVLADLLVEAGQVTAAWLTLTQNSSADDARFTSRLLDIAAAVDPVETQQALINLTQRSGASPKQWPPSQRLELANLLELNGQVGDALDLYRSTPAGAGDVARIDAEVAFAQGDVSRAVDLQRRYLTTASEPDYEGWMFLGDLHQAAGQATAARDAYQKALEILRGRVDESAPNPNSTATDSTPLASPSDREGILTSHVTLDTLRARLQFDERN
jgi:tetratricopeptide (TPR) repeat protein